MNNQSITKTNTSDKEPLYLENGWWNDQRLEARFKSIVDKHPEDIALIDNHNRSFNYQQLWQKSGEFSTELANHNISEGDRVLIVMPNWAEYQQVLLAILRLKAIPATIPITMSNDNLVYATDIIQSKLIITADQQENRNFAKDCMEVANLSNSKPGVLSISSEAHYQWHQEPKLGQNLDSQTQHLLTNKIDHLCFTSSTTGYPKAVMHSANTLGALNMTIAERFSIKQDQAIFMGSPLGHSVGAYHGCRLSLYTGAKLVIQERWDPKQALSMIEEYQCTFTAAATPFLKDLVDVEWQGKSRKLASMKSFLCGGAPVPPVLLEQAWQAFPDTLITNLWGMTEGGLVTCTNDSAKEKVISTAGIGLPGLELQVLDETNNSLASGEEGELAMRGPGVFVGYMGQDDLYHSFITDDGFFKTGDLAKIDEQGYVQITGRLKDLIIRGGVNISPIPIEDTIAKHPDIKSIAVIGYPDERLGERICAVIEPRDKKIDKESLVEFVLKKGLNKRYLPEVLQHVCKMPRTANGKIRKIDLQKIILEQDSEYIMT